MPELDDAEIARRLLHHLARSFGCPAAVYLAGPARIQGGFDTTIFGFTLDAVPPPLQGPLILRLSRPGADPQRETGNGHPEYARRDGLSRAGSAGERA